MQPCWVTHEAAVKARERRVIGDMRSACTHIEHVVEGRIVPHADNEVLAVTEDPNQRRHPPHDVADVAEDPDQVVVEADSGAAAIAAGADRQAPLRALAPGWPEASGDGNADAVGTRECECAHTAQAGGKICPRALRVCVEVSGADEGCAQRENRGQDGPRVPRRGCHPIGYSEARRSEEQAGRRKAVEEEAEFGLSGVSVGTVREDAELASKPRRRE
eukprot:4624167-Prymnesium_polylepis.2